MIASGPDTFAAMWRSTTATEFAARRIAIDAHRGQEDKAGFPYLTHPARIVAHLIATGRTTFGRRDGISLETVLAAAWLHDVVEDCPEWPLARVAASGLPEQVTGIVDALTHRRGESNMAYYQRLCQTDGAPDVKRVDLLDNSDPARLALIGDAATVARLIGKYGVAREAIDRFEAEASRG